MLLHVRRYYRISDKEPPVEKVSNTSPAYEKSTVKPRPTTLPFIRPPLYYKHIIWPKIKTLSLPHFRLSKKSFVRCKAPDLSRLRRSRGRFNSRPKRFVLLAKKLERSTCSKSTLFFKTSFTLTLCLNDLEPILALTKVPTGHCSSSSDFMFCYASLAKAHR